jgi:hypothetical protein
MRFLYGFRNVAKRSILQGLWAGVFLFPLLYYEGGAKASYILAPMFMVMPLLFSLGDRVLSTLLDILTARMVSSEFSPPPTEPSRNPPSVIFMIVFIFGIGIAMLPLFAKHDAGLRGGATGLGYLVALVCLLACFSSTSQRAKNEKKIKLSGVLTLIGFSTYFGFLLNRYGHDIAILTTLGSLSAGIFGYALAVFIVPSLDALTEIWHELRRMGSVLGAFLCGYLLLILAFGIFYAAAWRYDSTSFGKEFPPNPVFGHFVYFSVVTAATLGYGDITPIRPLVRMLASIEVLLGIAWTIAGFAATSVLLNRLDRSHLGTEEGFNHTNLPN